MNWNAIIQKLKELAKKASPYVKGFVIFLWEHKLYSLITFLFGAFFGFLAA